MSQKQQIQFLLAIDWLIFHIYQYMSLNQNSSPRSNNSIKQTNGQRRSVRFILPHESSENLDEKSNQNRSKSQDGFVFETICLSDRPKAPKQRNYVTVLVQPQLPISTYMSKKQSKFGNKCKEKVAKKSTKANNVGKEMELISISQEIQQPNFTVQASNLALKKKGNVQQLQIKKGSNRLVQKSKKILKKNQKQSKEDSQQESQRSKSTQKICLKEAGRSKKTQAQQKNQKEEAPAPQLSLSLQEFEGFKLAKDESIIYQFSSKVDGKRKQVQLKSKELHILNKGLKLQILKIYLLEE